VGDADRPVLDEWERHAAWWRREFTAGADDEYTQQILPLVRGALPSQGLVLDVGCGDGQVGSYAVSDGRAVLGVDAVRSQLVAARTRDGSRFAQGTVTSLPVASAAVDAVVCSLVLEHVADLDAALAEAARVLRPGGVLVVVMNHPLLQSPGSCWIDDQVLDPPEQYWRVGAYLREATTVEDVDDGVELTFHHRPLGRYVNAAGALGLRLERLEEPPPPTRHLEEFWNFSGAESIPRLAVLVFRSS